MINFHTISLKAREIFDPETGLPNSEFTCSPLEVLVQKAHTLNFHEGDQASAMLTDGTRFEMHYENERWQCRYYTDIRNHDGGEMLPGSYDRLEEALIEVISRRNYISSIN